MAMEILGVVVAAIIFGGILIVLSVFVVLAVLPFFKEALLDRPGKVGITLFAAPEPGQAMLLMRGQRLGHVIHGKDRGESNLENCETFSSSILRTYDKYAFIFGLRFVGIPGIHSIRHYDLPRYRRSITEGKFAYEAVPKDDPNRVSNHFRTQITTWFNEIPGIEIEGIPFTVRCATNYRIDKDKIGELAFGVDSWNILLDQSLSSVVRGYIREFVVLDEALGATSKDLFRNLDHPEAPTTGTRIQDEVFKRLVEYKPKKSGTGKTLADLGIVLESFEILDFSAQDLTSDELLKLRLPALARREAQARAMAGAAEAEYQSKVLEVLSKYPELARANVEAEAFVKAAKAGTLDSLVAALLKSLTRR